ncbi:MAG: hypothetical protein ABW189_03020 [Rickettsiales bacterium]
MPFGAWKKKETPPLYAYSRDDALAASVAWNGRAVGTASLYCLIAISAKCAKSLLPRTAEPIFAAAAARRCALRFVRAFSVPSSETRAVAAAFFAARQDATPIERYVDILLRAKDARPEEAALRTLDFLDDGRLSYNHAVFYAYARLMPLLFGIKAEEKGTSVVRNHFDARRRRLAQSRENDGAAYAMRLLSRSHPDKYAVLAPPKLLIRAVDDLYADAAAAYKRNKAPFLSKNKRISAGDSSEKGVFSLFKR